MNKDATTEDLIQQLQVGDEKSLGELMNHYHSHIWPLILSESRNYQDAQEILQDTWQAVWENIGGLRDVSSFGGWFWDSADYYYDAYMDAWGY